MTSQLMEEEIYLMHFALFDHRNAGLPHVRKASEYRTVALDSGMSQFESKNSQ